jgi:endonuclease III
MELRERIVLILKLLKEATKEMQKPMVTLIAEEYGRDPFLILISCLLSLRAKDVVTYGISRKLFARARTPQELVKLDRAELEELFYPLGFYRKKAALVIDVAHELLNRFDGKVPQGEDELLSIKGVGRKTANLVLGEAFGIPAICVDTHVHRVANRLGWVQTTDPAATEQELRRVVPQEYWIVLNQYLVMWGQNICVPLSPWCSKCVLRPHCPQVGVTRKR